MQKSLDFANIIIYNTNNPRRKEIAMDKLPEQKIKLEGKAYKWFDNYWYHYKWPTIIVAFFTVAFLVMGLQMCGKEDMDAYIIYAGPYVFEDTEAADMASEISKVMSGDYDGDGKKTAELVDLYILSQAQIEEEKNAADAEEEVYYYNAQFFAEERKKFDQLIFAGEYSICMLDPHLYEYVKESGGFKPLSEIFEEVPASAIDEYGIKLSDTGFGKYFTNIAKLPEDTVLCMRRESTMSFLNRDKAEREYAFYLQTFKDIVEFDISE